MTSGLCLLEGFADSEALREIFLRFRACWRVEHVRTGLLMESTPGH